LPVRLLAASRASDILEPDDGRIFRRFKGRGDPEREALVMKHVADHAFPVPRVLETRPDGLLLERIEGPTMFEDMKRRPWRLRRAARVLAELHRRLHAIPAPATLPAVGPGDAVLHLDLHPLNVLLAPRGPVVIDWTNARRGEPALDAALTYVIAATSGGRLGRLFARAFVAHFDPDHVARGLPAAVDFRLRDANVRDSEREAVRRLASRFIVHSPSR
ncbi:MAG: phosphotransferase, partial [Actinomycetota bacterium]|nr:phosphotransferase [Actinomycetota bacterium]